MRRKQKKQSMRKTNLIFARAQTQRNAFTLQQLVTHKGTGSTRSSPGKKMVSDDGDDWYEVLERELFHKREAREQKLQLRRDELVLRKARWEEKKGPREQSRSIT